MRVVYFTHSLVSCWNHGNAHFLRGVLRALQADGHSVQAIEPSQSWSRENLKADQGADALDIFGQAYPDLHTRILAGAEDLDAALEGADLVVVHEWNEPALVARIGRHRRRHGYTLLFHDTHHRAVSDPDAIRAFDLQDYDGVLAFGETLARVYEAWGWADRVFVWHEAADTTLFHPPAQERDRAGAVWVGNWGDGERTAELEAFLFAPASRAGLSLDVHGVRYPEAALSTLARYGVRYHGWIANSAVPELFGRYALTVHVPRRYYTQMLPGIPTIRVFEALACGIPLISAPWTDSEHLFRPGRDYLVADDGAAMEAHMRDVLNDRALASSLAESGLGRILGAHTCSHRARELLTIHERLATSRVAA